MEGTCRDMVGRIGAGTGSARSSPSIEGCRCARLRQASARHPIFLAFFPAPFPAFSLALLIGILLALAPAAAAGLRAGFACPDRSSWQSKPAGEDLQPSS